ncbi:Glucooligosaccharide oxidase [Neofusicoccum parvum]|uniref:Glucooligosaccharide oxidase n=1 Tax=Neofusicoccum parvum TaxID=310453 RepID=A0ACB5S716_9PEZI|nr:Glucooligosaccharide oxidase [Neofusicoccum parvum]GME44368.1 Glucooligosaccharide oxidase [Neofusicoccum parvum]
MIKSILAVGALAGCSLAAPAPGANVARALAVSPDGSCGGSTGYTCEGSSFGSCCSQYGWCGTSTAYCGTGCDASGGKCGTGDSATTSTPPASSATSAPPASTPTGGAASTLTDCLGEKDVPIKLTSDADFSTLSKPYNLRLPYNPAVIVIPTTVQHISDAVVCASENNVKVQAKSGGHSYSSFSSGGKDGSMIINLQEFQDVTLDDQGIAKVGGGLRLGNLAQSIYDQGKRALSHGTCPGVGIGGHFTHGGYGYASRNWGLAMDQIVGLDVVLANGSAIHATETEYPEVYYALRGAADSFGIVTSFYLQTHEAPSSVTYFAYPLPGMWDDATKTAGYFQHIQDAVQNASIIDRNIGGLGMYMDGSGFSLSGSYFGTVDDFNNKVAPELLRGLPTPTSKTVESLSWIDFLIKLGGAKSLSTPKTGYDSHDNFFAKSVTVPEASPLTEDQLVSYFNYMITQGKSAPASWYSIINLYGGPDSQVNAKDVNFAAYSDRSSLWVAQHYIFTDATSTLPTSSIDWLDGLNNAMTDKMPNANFGAYLNYVDPSLSAADAHEVYYGDSLYQKLAGIKTSVDPKSVFWNPQAIGA